jgi:hypothetical protein
MSRIRRARAESDGSRAVELTIPAMPHMIRLRMSKRDTSIFQRKSRKLTVVCQATLAQW